MTDVSEPKEHLAAILSADVVGYSRLMHKDERATIATLDEFRDVFRRSIEVHHGRIVDMAGDSILAIFESAAGAVKAATEAQAELAQRNEALSEDRRMLFRVGVNLGDILEKEDGTVYGDGVNVASRLEALASAGGINVSGSVFESVRTKVGGPFAFLGEQQLKNIDDPVSVYQVGEKGAGSTAIRPAKTVGGEIDHRPTVAVSRLKAIGSGDETALLAEGLYDDILGSLTKQTAIAVVSSASDDPGASAMAERADFRLEGSIRATGERLRLSFALLDAAAGNQVWSERYDRNLDDIFDLEDEISLSVASAVRIRIKARTFEKLRNTVNDALSVPELLSKAAGYFVTSYSHNEEAAEALRLALKRKPDNSMAMVMLVFCRYRMLEFSPLNVPEETVAELFAGVRAALALDNASFFAHLIAAVLNQDLKGDYDAARIHAETALEANPGFSQASAMLGIVKVHLGDPEGGMRLIQAGIDAAPEDPHRFRHMRELSLAHFIAGDSGKAVSVIERLVYQAPELSRNHPIEAALLWEAGQQDRARERVEELLRSNPELTQHTMRAVHIHDATMAARFSQNLGEAGLAPSNPCLAGTGRERAQR